MHAGDPHTSKRLRETLGFLVARGDHGATTLEIHDHTGSMAPGTDVSALRQSGFQIACRCEGRNSNGNKVYRYTFQGHRVPL